MWAVPQVRRPTLVLYNGLLVLLLLLLLPRHWQSLAPKRQTPRKPNLRVTPLILRLVQDRHPRLPLGQLLPRLVEDRKLYHVALSETGALPRDCSNALHAVTEWTSLPLYAFAVSVGADRRGRGLSWWTMPSKGSQVAKARNIDGEMVVHHEGPYKRPPRRTIAASKDHHVRMASPPLPPPEATQAMETHPIRAPREGL